MGRHVQRRRARHRRVPDHELGDQRQRCRRDRDRSCVAARLRCRNRRRSAPPSPGHDRRGPRPSHDRRPRRIQLRPTLGALLRGVRARSVDGVLQPRRVQSVAVARRRQRTRRRELRPVVRGRALPDRARTPCRCRCRHARSERCVWHQLRHIHRLSNRTRRPAQSSYRIGRTRQPSR